MARAGGLGRGLASLIPQKKKSSQPEDVNYFGAAGTDESEQQYEFQTKKLEEPNRKSGAIGDIALKSVIEVPVGAISSNPYQPRKYFNPEKLQELSDSIGVHGVIQPLVVTRKGLDEYELIAGERRLEASKLAGLSRVPVVVKDVNDQEKLELALIENIQRHNLNPIEEARSYKQLSEVFDLKQEEVAKRVGKSRSAVANSMRLLQLPIEIQKALQEGKISEGHARTILAVSNPEKQRALFELILKNSLTVRQVEEKVREIEVSSHRRAPRNVDPEVVSYEQQLSNVLGTRVKIKKGSKGGSIAIDYFSSEEFENIFSKLAKLD